MSATRTATPPPNGRHAAERAKQNSDPAKRVTHSRGVLRGISPWFARREANLRPMASPTRPQPADSASSRQDRIEALETELARARAELRACRDALHRSESALAAIADGIVVTDLQGRITSLNPVAAHLTGWTEADALGLPLGQVVRSVDARGDPVDLLTAGFNNGNEDIVSLLRRDGHVILVDGAVAQVHDQDREPIGSIVTFRNVTAATRMSRELSWHANHDALTGLLNRRVFDTRLERAVHSAAELGCRHALLYFDLDHFKAVNDTGGHVAGDELLRQLAVILRRQLREHDTLARIGGDEFAMLLENCTEPRATAVANKILATMAGFEFGWEGQSYRIGASVGQVGFSGAGLTALEVLEAADRMCYVAKETGRNRIAAEELSGYAPRKGRGRLQQEARA
ncbi:diguanylate cyclase domain-containing protein [Xenophilus sp.]|uniref:diguanylate cyclase domain-containing protein n=1 Tax=Xenophilus sp. TaxID=1873499 RepID=UPI0037DC82FB